MFSKYLILSILSASLSISAQKLINFSEKFFLNGHILRKGFPNIQIVSEENFEDLFKKRHPNASIEAPKKNAFDKPFLPSLHNAYNLIGNHVYYPDLFWNIHNNRLYSVIPFKTLSHYLLTEEKVSNEKWTSIGKEVASLFSLTPCLPGFNLALSPENIAFDGHDVKIFPLSFVQYNYFVGQKIHRERKIAEECYSLLLALCDSNEDVQFFNNAMSYMEDGIVSVLGYKFDLRKALQNIAEKGTQTDVMQSYLSQASNKMYTQNWFSSLSLSLAIQGKGDEELYVGPSS